MVGKFGSLDCASGNEMKNIVLRDAQARQQATRHFFHRALHESAREFARLSRLFHSLLQLAFEGCERTGEEETTMAKEIIPLERGFSVVWGCQNSHSSWVSELGQDFVAD